MAKKEAQTHWRFRIHEVIFEADTFYGKLFDVSLLIAIILSLIMVMLDSIDWIRADYGYYLDIAEWSITILFSFEYILRVISVKKPSGYIFSFYGIIDLLATLPTYLSLIFVGSQYLVVLRILRLLRVFRIFKLTQYLQESQILVKALKASRVKITVFIGAVMAVVVIIGSLMYVIEGGYNKGFSSIPQSIYWAIVTLTTVGYGDVAPVTVLGKLMASIVMIMGYGIIAVPTGIVSVELARAQPDGEITTQSCPSCSQEGHDEDAEYCKYCGEEL